jgi:predicted ATPase
MKRDATVGAPLIGRRTELDRCRTILSKIGEGSSGAVVVVRGEPGIGKTRLLEEAQSIAVGMGFSRHSGWVLDFGTERGHGAVRTIVAGLLGVARDASAEAAETAIVAAKPTGDDSLYLRDLLEIPQRESDRPLYEAIDRPARARAKERVLVDLIAAAARLNPLLVTIEDVHWADPETLALLAAFARSTTRSRAAMVMTTRTGSDPLDAGWRAAAGDCLQLTVDLAPLAQAESQEIASGFSAAEDFAAKCVERAGGNPLFLEQLLRTAGDLGSGLIDHSQNMMAAAMQIAEK